MAGELIAVAMLLLVGVGNVLLTLYMRPVAVVAKNIYERKGVGRRKLVLVLAMAAIVGIVVYAKHQFALPPQAQGMFAAQMLVIVLALMSVGKRQLTIWFAHDGRPRMWLVSMPLWVMVSAVAMLVDSLKFPRTLDAVMVWWRLGIFDNPHIPEGASVGGGFAHQLYFAEEHVVLGVFTPVAIIMLLGAAAVWAKMYNNKALVFVPLGGLVFSLIAVTVVAEASNQVIMAPPIMFVCTFVPLLGLVQGSPYRKMLWSWSQNWDHEQLRVTDGA